MATLRRERSEGAFDVDASAPAAPVTRVEIRSLPKERACIASFPGGLPSALRRRHPPSREDDAAPRQQKPPRFLFPESTSGPSNPSNHHHTPALGRMILGKDSTCLYAGPVEGGAPLCVGLYDKHTRTLQLIPTSLACVRQSVIFYNANKQQSSSTEGAASSTTTRSSNNAVSKRTLAEDFGSVKKQRALKSQEANRVDADNVVGSSLTEFLGQTNPEAAPTSAATESSETPAPSAVELATREWRKTFLPPLDATTAEPTHVYQMERFAGDTAWRCVSKQAGALLRSANHQQALAEAEYLPSLQKVLTQLVASPSVSPEKLYCVKCAILCQNLAKLYLQLHKRRFIPPLNDQVRPQYFGVALEVASLFLTAFTTTTVSPGRSGGGGAEPSLREGHVMSKANVDKCRMHLLLLCLAAYQCHNMPLEGVAGDLQLDLRDATHLLRLAGCTHLKRHGALVVDLKGPVTFPEAGKRMVRR